MTQTIGKWSYLIGLLVAVVTALFSFSAEWLTLILAILAILAGLFYKDPEDVKGFAISYLALVAVAAALDGFIGIGTYLTSIFTAVAMFLAPVLLTVLVVRFVKKELKF